MSDIRDNDYISITDSHNSTISGYVQEYKSVLIINNSYHIRSVNPMPNWWWRMWQWVLLGWKWRKS